MELNQNEKQFIEEISIQLTELYYGADTYESKDSKDTTYGFTDEAENYYEGKYDEWKTYYIQIIKDKLKNK